MSALLTDEEIRGLAVVLVRLNGTAVEYVDVVDVVSDYLEANGYDVAAVEYDALDSLYSEVSRYCSEALVVIPNWVQ